MPKSAIERLPASTRSRWLKKISANLNAPGAGKKQIQRAKGCAGTMLTNRLGIYPIESRVTGALAASIGGAGPATIDTGGGTPATTLITATELDPITWAGGGVKNLTVTLVTNVQGEASISV
jgi:hypothetical protein